MNEKDLFDRVDKIKDSLHLLTLEVRKNNGIKERVEKNVEAINNLITSISTCSALIQSHVNDHKVIAAKKTVSFGQVFTVITTFIALGALIIAIVK